jgi:hypothetical protein
MGAWHSSCDQVKIPTKILSLKEGLIHLSTNHSEAHIIDHNGYKTGHIQSSLRYSGHVYMKSNGHFFAQGNGMLTLASGESYKGQFKDGVPHGHGEAFYLNQSHYIGEWKHGCKHGRGLLSWKGGHQFKGTWNNDVRDGYGYHTNSDGEGQLEHWVKGIQTQLNEVD